MKKTFWCLLLACASLVVAQAQDLSQPLPDASVPYLTKVKHAFVLGDQTMDRKAYVHFLQTNCPAAYQYRLQADKLYKTGWGLFGGGLGVGVVGAFTASFGFAYLIGVGIGAAFASDDSVVRQGAVICVSGLVCLGAGAAATIASIPCLAVGAHRRDQGSMDIYNRSCLAPQPTALRLNVQTSSNGIGLALQW